MSVDTTSPVAPQPDRPVVLPKLDETERPENAKRMMRTAVQLFARKGYAGTSVREIVQAADVTNPMLYYYFDSKKGLFKALLQYLMETLGDEVLEEVGSAQELEERVGTIIEVFFRRARKSPIALSFVYHALFGPEENVPDFDIFAMRESLVEGIVGDFERAIDAGEIDPPSAFDAKYLTEQLMGLVNNHFIRAIQESDRRGSPPERRAHLRRMLSEEEAEKLRRFFFTGAGHLSDRDR